ncbi:MAG: DUF6089 family protein [Tannerellaceae bacterium]|nr:DUF6089 family protein [Tannerellaceae bacterium]
MSLIRRVIFCLLLFRGYFLWYSTEALLAQEFKYEIGGTGGMGSYLGDVNKTVPLLDSRAMVGAMFRGNPNFRWAYKTQLLWGQIAGSSNGTDNVFPALLSPEVRFRRSWIEVSGQGEFNFFPYSDKFGYLNTRRLTPYIAFGLGLTVASGGDRLFVAMHIPVGVGVKYKLMNRINVGSELTFRKLLSDGFEGVTALKDPYGITSSLWKNKDWYVCLQLSLTWDFGLRTAACNNATGIPKKEKTKKRRSKKDKGEPVGSPLLQTL